MRCVSTLLACFALAAPGMAQTAPPAYVDATAFDILPETTSEESCYLNRLMRNDPAARRHEDLGVLRIRNPDYFDWSRIPDGALTPLHHHMAPRAAHDGALYATILYPFTLLQIDGFRLPPSPASTPPAPAAAYLHALAGKLEEARARLPQIAALAEQMAERHLHGGLIGFPSIGSTLEQELVGRSGGLMNIGFDRAWKPQRTPEEKAQDMAIFSWDADPKPDDLAKLRHAKEQGLFLIGFGPRASAKLAEHAAACDAWIDTGAGDDDRAVSLPDGRRVGKTNIFANAVNGWLFTGEFVAALTRRGKMPVMWKSWFTVDGRAWSDRYAGKRQFH
jgi:hypothetical protein